MSTAETFAFKKYNGRLGTGLFRRCKDKAELLHVCLQGRSVWVKYLGNDVRQCKVTSILQWKRSPNRVEVRLKYGLYEHMNFSLLEALDRVLVEVLK